MATVSLVTVCGKAVHLTNRGSNFVPRGPASDLRIDVCQGLLLSIKAKLVHASSQMREISVCLLLLEQDYSQDYSYTNEFVEGQDILRALLNSLPLSHLSSLCLQGHASCITGCFLFLVSFLGCGCLLFGGFFLAVGMQPV